MHGQSDALVELPLPSLKRHATNNFGLGRQFPYHFLLGTPQHERLQAFCQALGGLFIPISFDRGTHQALKQFLASQKTGQQEVEQRPELPQMIFHGCAGETESMPRIQFPYHPAGLGFRILDGLGLIQYQQMILLIQQPDPVPPK